jgi:hypothetical protein
MSPGSFEGCAWGHFFGVRMGFREDAVTLFTAVKKYEAALAYVARHKDTPQQLAAVILDECVTVAQQALIQGQWSLRDVDGSKLGFHPEGAPVAPQ